MKKNHDELASIKRKEDYSKIWFVKSLDLLKKEKININNVIDIGAGKGEFLEILKNNFKVTNLFAIDYTETNLKILGDKNIQAIRIDLDKFKIEDFSYLKNKFNLVVCLETIEHIFNTNKLFCFFYYILEKDGHLLISTPNMESFRAKLFYLLKGYPIGESHHIRFFNWNKLNQYAFFNGFNTINQNNYLTLDRDIVKRTFSIRNEFLIKVIDRLIYLKLKVLKNLKLCNYLAYNGFVVLYKKSPFPPLGVEVEYFKINYNRLDDNGKELWIERIRKYYKKDNLKEHIYFRDYIEKIIT